MECGWDACTCNARRLKNSVESWGGTSYRYQDTHSRRLANRSVLTGLAAELERVPAPEEVWSLEDMEGAHGALALTLLLTVENMYLPCHRKVPCVRNGGVPLTSTCIWFAITQCSKSGHELSGRLRNSLCAMPAVFA